MKTIHLVDGHKIKRQCSLNALTFTDINHICNYFRAANSSLVKGNVSFHTCLWDSEGKSHFIWPIEPISRYGKAAKKLYSLINGMSGVLMEIYGEEAFYKDLFDFRGLFDLDALHVEQGIQLPFVHAKNPFYLE